MSTLASFYLAQATPIVWVMAVSRDSCAPSRQASGGRKSPVSGSFAHPNPYVTLSSFLDPSSVFPTLRPHLSQLVAFCYAAPARSFWTSVLEASFMREATVPIP